MKIADSILKSSKLLLLFLFEKDKVEQFILLCIILTLKHWFGSYLFIQKNLHKGKCVHIDIIQFMFYWGECFSQISKGG